VILDGPAGICDMKWLPCEVLYICLGAVMAYGAGCTTERVLLSRTGCCDCFKKQYCSVLRNRKRPNDLLFQVLLVATACCTGVFVYRQV
jgi:hypothetical protein